MSSLLSTANSYEIVQRKIADKIRDENFCAGDRLPSERAMAELFNVSYMTLRRAISEMVDRDILERRPYSGTYLKPEGYRCLNNQSLLLVTFGGSGLANQFIATGMKEAHRRGWAPRVVQMNNVQDRVVIQALISGEPALVLSAPGAMTPQMVKALQEAQGRCVLLGSRLDAMGLASVVADDAQGVRLAMQHLQKQGHKHIAILGTDMNYNISQLQVATWKSCMQGFDGPESDYLLEVKVPRFTIPQDPCYTAMCQWLKNRPRQITAMLCLVGEMLPAVIRAILDEGLRVPEDLSLVGFGNTAVARYANPAVTSIDPHIEQHVQKAMDLIGIALDGGDHNTTNPCLIQIEPELIERSSVKDRSP